MFFIRMVTKTCSISCFHEIRINTVSIQFYPHGCNWYAAAPLVHHQQGVGLETHLITSPFRSKLNDSIRNPIILILRVARPLSPSQFDGICHAINPNKGQTLLSVNSDTEASFTSEQTDKRAAGSLFSESLGWFSEGQWC